ncbi:CDGSH iron-sulfur domain-containing protein [Rhodococcus sp. SGAir0479]|uniref:CDGSH iron-sulfur domain-containing protein n=1 Tax=Rhodococcus sp. SGAir0479 TaxID=2567884 RepID=UPI0010CCE2C9|nr:CDGSH iron-sulfur domain-containing protein [Rhodococcus sp. SGAir0479]
MTDPRNSAASTPEPPQVTVKTVDNGPLQVKGPIQVVDHSGTIYELGSRRTVFLCRCGASASKPFCDGAHAKTGFHATERAQPQR